MEARFWAAALPWARASTEYDIADSNVLADLCFNEHAHVVIISGPKHTESEIRHGLVITQHVGNPVPD